MIILAMFVVTSAIFAHCRKSVDTEDATTSDVVQNMALELQKLLGDMEEDVSKLTDFSSAIVVNLQLPLEEGRKRVEVFRSMIADTKHKIVESCDFWRNKKKSSPGEAAKKKEQLKNLVALLEMVPEFFGEGAFRLDEATKAAISETCHKLKDLKKTVTKKCVEVEDLEKLRAALFMVRKDFLRLSRVTEVLGWLVFIFHGCCGAFTAAEDFTDNSGKFESACRDVYGSFGDTDLKKEALFMFEEAQRRTAAASCHIERGEKAMEEIKRLQASAEKSEERVNAFWEELYSAFINARYEMSFMKEKFSHIKPPLLCFIANMELGKLRIRNERLRFFGFAQNGRFK